MKNFRKDNGITLIALVVTIVVLLILAGITISTLFGENGIINAARRAADETANAENTTEQGIKDLEGQMTGALGQAIDVTSSTVMTTEHDTINVKDSLDNIFILPKGFRVVAHGVNTTTYADPDSPTVQDGIVVSDSNDENGNEFVWIPIGDVNILNEEGNKETVNIELARYDFKASTSTIDNSRIVKQSASDYVTDIAFEPINPSNESWVVIEYAKRVNPDGISAYDSTGRNAIAKDLSNFISSAVFNKGYYLARFEASKETRIEENNTLYIPASKYSKDTWTNVSQINSALASRLMYKDQDKNVGVTSDLVNSYAWDTAIVFIEKMYIANNNYANTIRGGHNDTATTKLTTGQHNDKVCNIHDLSGNVGEYSTEYSTRSNGTDNYWPCVVRGGGYNDSKMRTSDRMGVTAAANGIHYTGFRPILYIKFP